MPSSTKRYINLVEKKNGRIVKNEQYEFDEIEKLLFGAEKETPFIKFNLYNYIFKKDKMLGTIRDATNEVLRSILMDDL